MKKNFSILNLNLADCSVTGVGKFLSRYPTFRASNFTLFYKKMGAQNQNARPIETQLETLLLVLYYLKSTYSFHF